MGELVAPLAVAVPAGTMISVPRTISAPFTSSVASGVVELIPIKGVVGVPHW